MKTTAFPWTDPTGTHAGSKARMMAGNDKRAARCHFAVSQLSPVKKGRHKGTLTLRRTRSKLSQPNNMMMVDMDAAEAHDGPVQARPTRAAAATLREVFGASPTAVFAAESDAPSASGQAQLSAEERAAEMARQIEVLRRELVTSQEAAEATIASQRRRIVALEDKVKTVMCEQIARP